MSRSWNLTSIPPTRFLIKLLLLLCWRSKRFIRRLSEPLKYPKYRLNISKFQGTSFLSSQHKTSYTVRLMKTARIIKSSYPSTHRRRFRARWSNQCHQQWEAKERWWFNSPALRHESICKRRMAFGYYIRSSTFRLCDAKDPHPSSYRRWYSKSFLQTNTWGQKADHAAKLWASGYEIYSRLSPALASMLEGLTATHDAKFFNEEAARLGNPIRKGIRGSPLNFGSGLESIHPIIRTNRKCDSDIFGPSWQCPAVTGWKSVFVNKGFTRRINGVTKDESDLLLGYLFNVRALFSPKPDVLALTIPFAVDYPKPWCTGPIQVEWKRSCHMG